MPKPMYVWSGTAWVSVATEVESLATYATQSYADNSSNVASGLKPIVPSSVAIGSGSSSVSALGAVSFTGASSVSLNGVFSSTYKNYQIVFTGSSPGGLNSLNIRWRVNNSDDSGSNYTRQGLVADSTSVNGFRALLTYAESGTIDTYQRTIITNVSSPFDTSPTTNNTFWGDSTTSARLVWFTNYHGLSTSYTGFTAYPSSSTMTGTISVYGYKI